MGFNFNLRATVLAAALSATVFNPALAQEQTPQKGGVLTVLHAPEPPVLTSGVNSGFTAGFVSGKIYEGLAAYDSEGNIKPVLAESWDISEDGLTVTFNLRHGVKWHDGEDFTSADVKFSLEKVWQKLHSRGRLIFANVSEVETPDDFTVILHLSQPSPDMMYSLNAFQAIVMPEHIFGASEDIAANPAINAPIGTGPWVFKEWQRGSYILMERNENYWDEGKPYPDRLVIRYIPDAAARAAALESGEAQLAVQTPVPLSDVERLTGQDNLEATTSGYEYFGNVSTTYFNTRKAPFDDINVRHAFAYATDRQAIIDNVWFGFGKIATGPIASYSKFYTSEGVPTYEYDPEKAMKLLDEAGYTPDADGIRMKLTYDVTPLGAQYQRMGELLKQQMAKIGVEITLRSEDVPTWIKRMFTDYDFDFYTAYNGIYSYPILTQWWGKNIRPGVPFSNSTGYLNERVDELMEATQIEPDEQKQMEYFHEIQRLLAEDLPVLVNFEMQEVTLFDSKVHDHSVNYDGAFGSLSDVWIEQ